MVDSGHAVSSEGLLGFRLPLMPTLGRGRELEAVTALLDRHPLVTITGPGGIGKSHLASVVASQGGSAGANGRSVVWIDLSSADCDDDVLVAIGTAVGVPLTSWPAVVPACDELPCGLVVVDNCEQVLGSVTRLAASVAGRHGGPAVLATSRVPLELAGEVTYRLGPLPFPTDTVRADEVAGWPAVALLLDRAIQVRPDIIVDQPLLDAATELCRRLDGNPLALLLAAAQFRRMPAAHILAAIERSIEVLALPRMAGPLHHRSIIGSLSRSLDLISGDGRLTLACAAAIHRSFDADDVHAIAPEGASWATVHRALGELADAGLLELVDDGRYRIGFVVRQFVEGESLLESATSSASERCSRATLDWVTANAVWGRGFDASGLALRAVDVARSLRWAAVVDPVLALRTLAEAGPALVAALPADSWVAWLCAHPDQSVWWARAVAALSVAAWSDATAPLRPLLPLVGDIAEHHKDQGLLRLLGALPAWEHSALGDLGASHAIVAEALAADDGFVVMLVATAAALASAQMGRHLDTARFCDAARSACANGKVSYDATVAPLAEAVVALQRGELDRAAAIVARSAAPGVGADAAGVLRARLAHLRGDQATLQQLAPQVPGHEASAVMWRAACLAADLSGDMVRVAALTGGPSCLPGRLDRLDVLLLRASTLVSLGDTAAAQQAITDLQDAATALAGPAPAIDAGSTLVLARQALAAGDLARADRLAHEALSLADEHDLRLTVLDALEVVASLADQRRNRRLAERIRGACDAARRSFGCRPIHRPFDQRSRSAEATNAYREGEGLDLRQALAVARRSRGARRRPTHGPGSLTPTERAVADLVTAGWSNAAIGEELLMALPTVKTHLSRIFAKLGVKNRTQLARVHVNS